MRLASQGEIASAVAPLTKETLQLTGYLDEMLRHSTAGHCLRNYGLLTEYPELVRSLGLSEVELFWSRYYWLARFAREWQAACGQDAGLAQQVFKLLESAEHIPNGYEPLPEVEAAVKRDGGTQDLE